MFVSFFNVMSKIKSNNFLRIKTFKIIYFIFFTEFLSYIYKYNNIFIIYY